MRPLEPVAQQATPTLIADQLRARIVDGTFPAGAQLLEQALARELEVSRGPVREALARLVQEGLLVSVRNRGVFVVTLGPADAADVYRARRALERAAAEDVCARPAHVLDALEAPVAAMADGARKGDWRQVADADVAFHEALVAASGSPRLARMFRTLAAETRMCVDALRGAYPDLGEIVEEHRTLLVALRSGRSDEALVALDEHLDRAVADLRSP